MNMADFVHLHVHSEYSMLDGLGQIGPLIAKAQELQQPALAITDHGGMYGAVHFYNACKKAGVKPIVGVELYFAENSRFDKQAKMGADQYHLTMLAMSHQGYVNLMHLVSYAHLEGFSYKPRIDFELLEKYHEDVIVLSGCPSSIFGKLIRQGQVEQAKDWLQKFKDLLGDRFYLEIQRHQYEFIDELNEELIKLSRQLEIPLVATNDVHYIDQNQAQAQDALLCVQTHRLISEDKRMTMMDSPDFHLRSTQEMVELFHDYPEAIENTVKIAERCNLEIPTGNLIFPNYPIPEGKTDAEYLHQLTLKGLEKRFGKDQVTSEHLERIDYELDIIKQKGYSTYFLITQDFVNWAKDQEIAVGPGRGSAAGSLVSYAIGITDINPLRHGLPFERFLNPQRPTPPDIDIDFADDRRDEVIQYAADKYGHDFVAQVITFGRMEARVAIRDIGRVLGMPYEEPDKIAKLIPNQPGKRVSLDQAVKIVPDLAQYYQQPKYKKLIDLAKEVEGVIRHSSVHAAAVVIADKSLMHYTPIQADTKSDKMVTQYDMYALDCNISDDAIGLLKFDFLGLRNLSTIQRAIQLIKENKDQTVQIGEIPLDDQKTYDLISSGDTTGIFQLESGGMRRVARNLQPNQFSDITAMVALYRPGPMDLIPQFIEGKNNPESIVYPHESLKEILQETYGVMVYQEQILQIANKMAGYTLGEADILRRAIGKKKKKLLDKNRQRFTEQSIENGYTRAVAEKVWGFIEAFADYGFNKSHAASYAMIAYQTAYLKANFPVEYMAALMSIEASSHSMNRDEKVAQAIETSKDMGIVVLPPDINQSGADFTIEKHSGSLQDWGIRFGFNAIKHVGEAAVENILGTRQELKKKQQSDQGFHSLTQFIQETEGRKVNKKVLEVLIKVGAMDQFGTRSSMLENLDQIRDKATQFQSDVDGQNNLFTTIEDEVQTLEDTFPQLKEYPKQELLSFEKKFLGLYLTEHPLADALSAVSKQAKKQLSEVDLELHQDQTFVFGGMITRIKEVRTKKRNKRMAFGTFEDESGSADFVAFPRTYAQYEPLLTIDNVVLLKGKVDQRDGKFQLIVEKIWQPTDISIKQAQADEAHEIFIPRKTDKDILQELGRLLKKNKGDDSVIVLIPNGNKPKKMLLPYKVNWSDDLAQQIQDLLKRWAHVYWGTMSPHGFLASNKKTATPTKYIFVSGGVLSGLGKGITTASLGVLLKSRGYSVNILKCENYLNLDSGNINPIEHGDVFLCEDGLESDLDLGSYERFLEQEVGEQNFVTMGQIYLSIIEKTRDLQFNGATVDAIPYIPEEVIHRISSLGRQSDIVLIELGGTAGEYQNVIYYEAYRILKQRAPKDTIHVHVTYFPLPSHIGELKSKPTQMSVKQLNSLGIQPDFIVGRGEKEIDDLRKEKVAYYCNIAKEDVISNPDLDSIYQVPLKFAEQDFDQKVLDKLSLPQNKSDLKSWKNLIKKITKEKEQQVTIGIIAKYIATGDFELKDSYQSLIEALKHAGWDQELELNLDFINAENLENGQKKELKKLKRADGLIVPIGWGERGVEGKIKAITYARENKIPYLGLCYGMQLAAIEYARNVADLKEANTTEVNPNTPHPIIHNIPFDEKYQRIKGDGASMRLGAYDCVLKPKTLAHQIYQKHHAFKDKAENLISERHRHRYEFNNDYRQKLEAAGLVIAGTSPDDFFVEMIELPKKEHPFFIATQAHPEYKSRPLHPHPMFIEFIKASFKEAQNWSWDLSRCQVEYNSQFELEAKKGSYGKKFYLQRAAD